MIVVGGLGEERNQLKFKLNEEKKIGLANLSRFKGVLKTYICQRLRYLVSKYLGTPTLSYFTMMRYFVTNKVGFFLVAIVDNSVCNSYNLSCV